MGGNLVRLARIGWALPYTLVGYLVAPLFDARRAVGDVLVCEGTRWPQKLGWGYRAITLGHVVLAVGPLDDGILRHELVHVSQYETWGPLYVPAYLVASLVAVLRGRHYYRDNAFEVAARREGVPR